MSLDGDMAGIILPSAWYSQVLQDPFGFSVWREGATYAATNRFFVHQVMSWYFKTMPFFLQHFTDTVHSIYWSAAIFKTVLQAGLIGLMSLLVGLVFNTRKDFWLIAVLITPLFQTFGYNIMMGIIEKSITYTFFYAFPSVLMLLFIFKFYSIEWNIGLNKSNLFSYFLMLTLIFIIPFSGPLMPAEGIILATLVILQQWNRAFQTTSVSGFQQFMVSFRRIPIHYILLASLLSALSLYSIYIGFSNLENGIPAVSVLERYLLLPLGLFEILTTKVGFPLLLILIVVNLWFIQQRKDYPDSQRILTIIKILALFSVLYLLILPLGGYREYRPLIIRRDTFLPVTLVLVFMFAMTTSWLLQQFQSKSKYLYSGIITALLLNFTLVDCAVKKENACEMESLNQISAAKEAVVPLDSDCTVLAWKKMTDSLESATNARMLQYWGITKEQKLYFQK